MSAPRSVWTAGGGGSECRVFARARMVCVGGWVARDFVRMVERAVAEEVRWAVETLTSVCAGGPKLSAERWRRALELRTARTLPLAGRWQVATPSPAGNQSLIE